MSPLVRLPAGIAALVVVYFIVPIQIDRNLWIRTALALVGIGVATALIVRQLRRPGSPLWRLALAIAGGVLIFALADYIVAVSVPGQFVGLHTRVDALYFVLTTLATVGYGDIHADGQLARIMISIQLVFNVVVVATAASILAGRLRTRAARSPRRNDS